MTLMALTFVACLNSAPAKCEVKNVNMEPGIGFLGCMIQGQQRIASWLDEEKGLYFLKPDSIRCTQSNGQKAEKA